MPRRGCRVVQPLEVMRTGQDRCALGFIEREVLRLRTGRMIAPPAQETGNADALGHVLMIVPFVELLAPVRRNVIPDRDDGLADEAHGFPFRSSPRKRGPRAKELDSRLRGNERRN